MPPSPGDCKCKRCIEQFRQFLARKYAADDPAKRTAGLERWGRTDFAHAKEPWFNRWNNPVLQREVNVANQQDWLLFRQEVFQKALLEWADYIHKLGGAVEYNTGKGFNSNYRMYGAINDEVLYPHTDIVFNEGALKVGYNAAGSPHTRIREHKVVQRFDLPMMNYNHNTHLMAEAFSFNPGMVGMWSMTSDPAKEQPKLKFFKFYQRYKHYQTRQASLAETAVLLHNESTIFSQIESVQAQCTITQLLQEKCIPFNFVYSTDLDALQPYRLLIIPSAHCLKDHEAEKIGAWVKSGGRLLTTGKTGTRDDYFRTRTKVKKVASIDDLMHAHETENVFTPLSGEDHTADFIKPVGEGMVANITRLDYASVPNLSTPDEWQVEARHINKPNNSAAVMTAIEKLLPRRNLEVVSEQDVLVDLCKRKDTGEGLVHIFNVSYAKKLPADATVFVNWPQKVESLTWIAYDRDETPVQFQPDGEGVRFVLKAIQESAVIIINKKPS
jgi:hypothetical protein